MSGMPGPSSSMRSVIVFAADVEQDLSARGIHDEIHLRLIRNDCDAAHHRGMNAEALERILDLSGYFSRIRKISAQNAIGTFKCLRHHLLSESAM